jgi:CheY-like chemotaxis protein
MPQILLVDDDRLLRQVLGQAISQMGHVVTQAANGLECLRAFRTGPFDLVITDLVMPEKEGIETILELRRTHPLTRIIAMSGGHDAKLVQSNLRCARQLGATRVLLKPFLKAELLGAIDEILGPVHPPGRQPDGG